jgi:ABC-type phosphate/phosphonate transport system substrate-binding protein
LSSSRIRGILARYASTDWTDLVRHPRVSLPLPVASAGAGSWCRRAVLATLAASALGANDLRAISQAGVCTLGIFPYLPALNIGDLFAPMAIEFGTALGVDIQLRTRETFEKFSADLAAGVYDIALLHPFLYVECHEAQDYLAIARVDQDLRAVIVSRSTRPIGKLEELRGQTLALPPRGSGVSYLVRSALLEEGLLEQADLRLHHHQTKVSCLHAVAAGEAAGCAVPSFLGDQLEAMREMRLAPVWRSPPIAGLAIATHPRLPASSRAALLACMTAWPSSDRGRALLARLAWPRIVAAQDSDYDHTRLLASRLRSAAGG